MSLAATFNQISTLEAQDVTSPPKVPGFLILQICTADPVLDYSVNPSGLRKFGQVEYSVNLSILGQREWGRASPPFAATFNQLSTLDAQDVTPLPEVARFVPRAQPVPRQRGLWPISMCF